MSPLFGLISLLRRARTFHPCGPVYHATVMPHPAARSDLEPLAARLAGRALVRFSGALWKHAESLPDVLGCAIRLRRDAGETPEPATDDQDLLFATIRRPWTMPFSPLTTDVGDYLANDYFTVSPFNAGLRCPVYLRLHPRTAARGDEGTRSERLARAVHRGHATLNLELGTDPSGPWRPLGVVSLQGPARVDGEALRFRPFQNGRGVQPRGFIHALRLGVYATSQRARPSSSRG